MHSQRWFTIACCAAGIVLLYAAAAPLFLIFAGLLFGTALRGAAEQTARVLHVGIRTALAITVLGLLALTTATILWIVPRLGEQISTLIDALPHAYEQVRARLDETQLGHALAKRSPDVRQLAEYALSAAGILTSIVGLLGSALFVTFVAFYVALAPEQYRRGITKLVLLQQRERANEVLDDLARVLRRWLLGRVVSMTAVAVVTGIGLWFLGVPLPATLALLAGLLGFIPNIGPMMSAVPALLLAGTLDPLHVLYVLILYLVVNLCDGYLLTPAIQKRAVQLPPALVLCAQVIIAALWGLLGLALATPLLACGVVLVEKLYVEASLNVDPNRSGSTSSASTKSEACQV